MFEKSLAMLSIFALTACGTAQNTSTTKASSTDSSRTTIDQTISASDTKLAKGDLLGACSALGDAQKSLDSSPMTDAEKTAVNARLVGRFKSAACSQVLDTVLPALKKSAAPAGTSADTTDAIAYWENLPAAEKAKLTPPNLPAAFISNVGRAVGRAVNNVGRDAQNGLNAAGRGLADAGRAGRNVAEVTAGALAAYQTYTLVTAVANISERAPEVQANDTSLDY